jgi:nitrate reductase gamma subunit
MKGTFLFAVWPYVAATGLVIGIAWRYFLSRKNWAVLPNPVSEAWTAFLEGRVWQISLLLILVFHLAGMLFPRELLRWNLDTARLYLLEGVAFFAGLSALVSGASQVWRHLGHSRGSLFSQLAETVFLSLLLVALLSGSVLAVVYRWGSTWGLMILTPYIRSLFVQPAVDSVARMPFLIRLHVFSSFAVMALLPATRLSAIPVAGVHACVNALARPLAAAERSVEAWLQKHNPAAWLWPEED